MTISKSEVKRIRNTFNDLMVVNAARVSFGKWHNNLDTEKDTKLVNYLVKNKHWSPLAHPMTRVEMLLPMMDWVTVLSDDTRRAGIVDIELVGIQGPFIHVCFTASLWCLLELGLINFCMDYCPISTRSYLDNLNGIIPPNDLSNNVRGIQGDTEIYTFHIKAPIFVARQLVKHRVGLTWNEISRRYVDSDIEYYSPEVWRARAENVKQGSSSEPVDDMTDDRYIQDINIIDNMYNDYLSKNISPELARMILPQSTMTEWLWTGTKQHFDRVLNQRLDSHAQVETREVVEQMKGLMKHHAI